MHNAASSGLPANGTNAVANATATAPNSAARRRDSATFPFIFIEAAPPKIPPTAPINGGIQASVRFTTAASIPQAFTKYGVVQFDHKLYTVITSMVATIKPQY